MDHVATDGWGGLDCVMCERVLVAWQEQRSDERRYFDCLGTCTGQQKEEKQSGLHDADNGCADCRGYVSFEIHQGMGTAMVKFHLPVKFPTSRCKESKSMYIVLPASSLSLSVTTVNKDTIPEDTRKHLPHASSYLYLHLDLDEAVPYAIMPELKRRS